MSKLTDVLSSIGRTIASPFNKLFATGMTQAQYEQNMWQSNEAALQRSWSSQEAERARDWQEEMYEKYNSLSGKIAQAEQAGVNPMFAITGNAVSPMSANAPLPSGAMPSPSSSPSESFVNLIGQLLGAKKIDSEIAVNESIAEKNSADASKANKEASWIDKLNEDKLLLNESQRDLVDEQIDYLNTQSNYINAIKEPEVRQKRAEALISEWQEKNKELFKGLEIGSDLLNTLVNLGIGIVNAKTGLKLAERPLVVGKGASVYYPSDIVH